MRSAMIDKLKMLHLPGFAENLELRLQEARGNRLDFEEFLEILIVPFRTIKLPALPVCSVNLQIQVASRNLRPYIRVWFTSRTLHRTGGYNDRR